MNRFNTFGGDKDGVFKALCDRIEKAVNSDEKLTWDSLLGRNGLRNAKSDREYSGFMNKFILSIASMGFDGDPRFITFAGCKELGGWVNKGAKFIPIWGPQMVPGEKTNADGNMEKCQIFTGRFRTILVLHVRETNLIEKGLLPEVWAEKNPEARPDVLNWFNLVPASKEEKITPRAYYDPQADVVNVPPFESFKSSFGFADAMAHELIHWTMKPSRCNREEAGAGNIRDREAYSFEELVACIGASFLLSHLGIPLGESEIDRQSAYLKTWLGRLKMDMGLLFEAASKAAEAADYIIREVKKAQGEKDEVSPEAVAA